MTTNQKTNGAPICIASHAPKPRPELADGCGKPLVDPVFATGKPVTNYGIQIGYRCKACGCINDQFGCGCNPYEPSY